MKNTHKCPKCESSEIFYVPGGLLNGQNNSVIGSFFYSIFRIARYVCTECGYTEEWVDRKDDMEVVRNLHSSS